VAALALVRTLGPNSLIVFARQGANVMYDAFSSTWTGWRGFAIPGTR